MFIGAAIGGGVVYRIAHSDYSDYHRDHSNHSRYSDSNVLAQIERDKKQLSQKRRELARIKELLESNREQLAELFESEELLAKYRHMVVADNVNVQKLTELIMADLEKELEDEQLELLEIDDALNKINEIELKCK